MKNPISWFICVLNVIIGSNLQTAGNVNPKVGLVFLFRKQSQSYANKKCAIFSFAGLPEVFLPTVATA